MKKRLMLPSLLFVLLAMAVRAHAVPWEFQGVAESYLPDQAIWSYAEGCEGRLILWATPEWGITFCAGLSEWASDGRTQQIPTIKGQRWQRIDGKSLCSAVGVSALYRPTPLSNGAAFGVEGGVRHLFFDDGMALMETNSIPGGSADRIDTYPLELGNGLVARLAGTLEWPLGPNSNLLVTGGYQFDLDPSEVTLARVTTIDGSSYHQAFDVSAFFLSVGVALPLN